MTFRNLLESKSLKLIGKTQPYEKILYSAFVEFLQEYYKTNINLEISLRKPNSKNFFGYIDLKGLTKKRYKIVVEHTLSGVLGKIAHEFTHIHQFLEGKLGYSNDETYIKWKKINFISVNDYADINDFDTYEKLPWENEAYKMQGIIPKLFLKSKQYKDMRSKEDTLDFLMDNNSIL